MSLGLSLCCEPSVESTERSFDQPRYVTHANAKFITEERGNPASAKRPRRCLSGLPVGIPFFNAGILPFPLQLIGQTQTFA